MFDQIKSKLVEYTEEKSNTESNEVPVDPSVIETVEETKMGSAVRYDFSQDSANLSRVSVAEEVKELILSGEVSTIVIVGLDLLEPRNGDVKPC